MDDYYSVILGKNASKTARSPQVWNKWYEALKSPVRMKPVDVNTDKVFEELVSHLNDDEYCLGGAVAVPFKGKMADLLGCNLGAVNCFYRNDEGNFVGENTDAAAGERLIIDNIESDDHLVFVGNGQTGSAILGCALIQQLPYMVVYARSPKLGSKVTQKSLSELSCFNSCSKKVIFFNATTVGGPLAIKEKLISEDLFQKLVNDGLSKVIDINNEQTMTSHLHELCLKYDISFINGNEMNKNQARLAFDLVNRNIQAL